MIHTSPSFDLFAYMALRTIITSLVFISTMTCNAQMDSVMYAIIDSVKVHGTKPSFSLENIAREQVINQDASLNQTIQGHHQVYIRNYGPGSISTISMRGANASQTQVIWNGLNINHPMLGLTDVSLISPISFDHIGLHSGSNTTTIGNGVIGGALLLQHLWTNTRPTLTFGATIGSFGHVQNHIQSNFSRKRWHVSTRLWHQYAKNNFPILESSSMRKQTNAKTQQVHLVQNARYQINANQHWDLHFWAFENQRQIPPLLTQNTSISQQRDQGVYFTTSHTLKQNNQTLHSQLGYTHHHLRFQDDLQGIDAPSQANTITLSSNYERNWRTHHLTHTLGADFEARWLLASAQGYEDDQKEWRNSVLQYYRLQWYQWSVRTAWRLSNRNNNYSPVAPEVYLAYRIDSSFTIGARVNRNFRFPAMNDLYWGLGGDQSLSPEEGWSQSMDVEVNLSKRHQWVSHLSAHHRLIKNWIFWAQQEGDQFFSATNLALVRSYGITARSEINLGSNFLGKKNIEWIYGFNYEWIKSIHEKSSQRPTLIVGQQLAYTPEHKFGQTIKIISAEHSLEFGHDYISSSIGINDHIDAFHLARVIYNYSTFFGKNNVRVKMQIENILNQEYQIIERIPMPGANYQLSLFIKMYP